MRHKTTDTVIDHLYQCLKPFGLQKTLRQQLMTSHPKGTLTIFSNVKTVELKSVGQVSDTIRLTGACNVQDLAKKTFRYRSLTKIRTKHEKNLVIITLFNYSKFLI